MAALPPALALALAMAAVAVAAADVIAAGKALINRTVIINWDMYYKCQPGAMAAVRSAWLALVWLCRPVR